MPTTRITVEAQEQFDALPLVIRARVAAVFVRLGRWASLSGAKPLRKDLAGRFRIRTGEY
jgi:hypothetical protein